MNYRKVLISLIRFAINDNNSERIEIDESGLQLLLLLAANHQLAALAAVGLRKCGINSEGFSKYRFEALWRERNVAMERQEVVRRLENEGIWYMPLKGAVLMEYYPQAGTREMSDIDILFDASHAEDVRSLMEKLGYETKEFDTGHRDDYWKPPVSHFEMHRVLFDEEVPDWPKEEFLSYYRDADKLLIKDDGNEFGYHFSDEDFYIYMVAHEYKHYIWGGTGLRSLVDVYVYLKAKNNSLNWEYIAGEIAKLGITDFEKQNRTLAIKLFSEGVSDELLPEETNMLDYVFASGTYGNWEHVITNSANRRKNILHYVLNRIFVPMRGIKKYYPFFSRHRLLIPFLPLYRLIHNRRRAGKEIRILRDRSQSHHNKEL